MRQGAVIDIIKQTIEQVLDDRGTGQEAIHKALDAAKQVQVLSLGKGTDDVDAYSDAVLEAAFGPGDE